MAALHELYSICGSEVPARLAMSTPHKILLSLTAASNLDAFIAAKYLAGEFFRSQLAQTADGIL